jgi:hypothetical protein
MEGLWVALFVIGFIVVLVAPFYIWKVKPKKKNEPYDGRIPPVGGG